MARLFALIPMVAGAGTLRNWPASRLSDPGASVGIAVPKRSAGPGFTPPTMLPRGSGRVR